MTKSLTLQNEIIKAVILVCKASRGLFGETGAGFWVEFTVS
jgi:hypothetical protein